MKQYLFPISAAFLLGALAGYIGLLLAIHHIQEPLAKSIHYVWYDWFMYTAWPGFILASCFFDPHNPASKSFGMAAISVANGVVTVVAFLALEGLLRLGRMMGNKS
ncbi:MAG: hypothetical protein LV479_01645 [Methylacidiphilales bacterium]|nr:hypothetical protein [Candidatus Methylacidiphilales bacterium]